MKRERKERKKAQDALHESEEKYRLLVENANDLIAVTQDGMLKFVNASMIKASGFSEEEVKKKPLENFIHPDDKEMVMRHHRRRLNGQETPETYDLRVVHKDGTIRWVQNNGVLITWEGKPATLNILSDITDRKKAEDLLREWEFKFRSLFHLSPQAIALTETETGRLIDVNEEFCEKTQFTKEEVQGKTTTELGLYSKRDRNRFIKELKKSGEISGLEMDFKGKDGSIVNTLMFSKILNVGEKPFILNVFFDMTERLREEKKLRESKAIAHALINAPKEVMLLIDTSGTILALNDRAAESWGRRQDELIGSNCYELFLPEVAEDKKTPVEKVIRSAKPMDFEEQRGERWFDNRIYPVFNSKGAVSQVAIYAKEITDRKLAEENLKKKEKELENKTNSLEELNIALKISLKKREKDKRELERKFLSNIKQLIVPYLEKLKMCPLEGKEKAYVEILESNLSDIVTPFSHTLSADYWKFTPREILVANLVKEGKRTKEIAELLHTTKRAIEFHRDSLRRKLGLNKKKVNLMSHLLSLP